MENNTPDTVSALNYNVFTNMISPSKLYILARATFVRTWKAIVRIVALVLIPVIFLGAIVGGIAYMEQTTLAGVLAVILVLLAIYFFTWMYSAAVYMLSLPEGHTIKAREAYVQTKSRVFSMLGTSILRMVIVFLGYILLVIPGVIFSIWFMMSQYLVVTEKLSPIAALKRARAFVKGHFWSVFLSMFVFGIISLGVFLLNVLLTFLLGLISEGFSNIVSILLSIAWAMFSFVYSYSIFSALKQAHSTKA